MAARTGKFDDLVRSETLYPAELTAHPWQLHYLTLVTLLHSTSDSTEGLEQAVAISSGTSKSDARPEPLLPIEAPLLQIVGNRIGHRRGPVAHPKISDVLSWHFPRSRVSRKRRKASHPFPADLPSFSSAVVSATDFSTLLCKCSVPFRVSNNKPLLPLIRQHVDRQKPRPIVRVK